LDRQRRKVDDEPRRTVWGPSSSYASGRPRRNASTNPTGARPRRAESRALDPPEPSWR